MSDYARREFLLAIGALGVGASGRLRLEATGRIRLGYAAITWGGKDEQAIADISAVGFKAIQLRSSAFDAYGTRPGVLKDLLAKHGLTFAILSSGDLKYQPADREAMLALHLSHAKFVRDAGGQFLQVIDELPKGRAVGPDDYKALADMLNTLGERTKAIGVPLVYHNHMNSTGEAPDALEAILADSAASSVGLLFDIAHYQQAGGDPVNAIGRPGRAEQTASRRGAETQSTRRRLPVSSRFLNVFSAPIRAAVIQIIALRLAACCSSAPHAPLREVVRDKRITRRAEGGQSLRGLCELGVRTSVTPGQTRVTCLTYDFTPRS